VLWLAAAGPVIAPATPGAQAEWANDLTPVSEADWNAERAAHLLARAGFGGTPEDVARLAALPPAQAVRQLVRWQEQENVALPAFREANIFPGEDFVPPLDGEIGDIVSRSVVTRRGLGVKLGWNLEGRWLQPILDQYFYLLFANRFETARAAEWQAGRMLRTRRPLEEKLALFWHGHFATSDEKVRDYRKMMAQWDLYRAKGNGNFRDLILGICRDPAIIVYLDGKQNVRGAPNENFARELMELFTLGVGNYTEQDVKEAARAFTGWGLRGNEFQRSWRHHDYDKKTFLGRTGRWDGDDVVDIILEQPAAADFIVAKLYRFFVREDLSPEVQRELAAQFRDGDYEIAPVLEQIFLSRDFYSDDTAGAHIKSPVELIVSTYGKLGADEIPSVPFFFTMSQGLGQTLYQPPNVAGWAGGRTWINPSTLILRHNFTRYVMFPGEYPPAEKSLMHILVSAVAGESMYLQMKELDARGDRQSLPSVSMGMSGFNRVEQPGSETFSLPWAVYAGAEKAIAGMGYLPSPPARFSLTSMLADRGIGDVKGAVDYLTTRFLDVPARPADRTRLVAYLESMTGGSRLDLEDPGLETQLRNLLHLIFSLPEYQVS
jgi:hypothetical protein